MRRILTLALLYGAMQLVMPLAAHDASAPATLLIFGFLVLAAYTSGELAALASLPKITGYLVAGVIFGPSLIGIVTPAAIEQLEPVNRLAVALIAFLAGVELRWGELKARGRAILTMLGLELTLSFVAIALVLWLLRAHIPFLRELDPGPVLVLCALFASVTMVHSPAVTMALLTETRAQGPVARTTLGIVLVADVVVVLVFSGMLSVTRASIPTAAGAPVASAAVITWEILGSLVVGALLGGAVALYMRFVQRELLLFAIVIAFFGAEIARITHVETLLTLVTAGFVTENVSSGDEGRALLHAMERSAVPVFVVFFALAGAAINLSVLAVLWPLALAVVAVRAGALFAGSSLGARWAGAPRAVQRHAWLGLIAQAGVANGLAGILAAAVPEYGVPMQTLILSVIAINAVAGQILFRIALARSGEVEAAAGAAVPAPAPRAASGG
ncbi:MAG: cation:proton antiporter [Gemmatimonadaceae bacterium]|nr:cation:proton antiporter [Gemmatimonadaceae bacterium]